MPGIFWVVPVASVVTVLFAIWLIVTTLRRSPGTPEMKKVGDMIYEGAWAFLKRQYSTIGMLSIVVAIIIAVVVGVLNGEKGLDQTMHDTNRLRLCLEDRCSLPGGRHLLRCSRFHRHDHCRQIQLPLRRCFAEEPE